MDIGEIEKIGDREMPGIPTFPRTLPLPVRAPAQPTTPAPAPVKTPEKVPA